MFEFKFDRTILGTYVFIGRKIYLERFLHPNMKAYCLHFYQLSNHSIQFGIDYYRCSIVRGSWLWLQRGVASLFLRAGQIVLPPFPRAAPRSEKICV